MYKQNCTFSGQASTKPYILRVPCKANKDCGENQHCIRERDKNNNNIVIGTFCGTRKCRNTEDCKDVGHITTGKNIAITCSNEMCTYNTSKNIPKNTPKTQKKNTTQNPGAGGHKLKSR